MLHITKSKLLHSFPVFVFEVSMYSKTSSTRGPRQTDVLNQGYSTAGLCKLINIHSKKKKKARNIKYNSGVFFGGGGGNTCYLNFYYIKLYINKIGYFYITVHVHKGHSEILI